MTATQEKAGAGQGAGRAGQKFGTFTVTGHIGSTSGVGVLYRFICDCGKEQVLYFHEVCGGGKVKVCQHSQGKAL